MVIGKGLKKGHLTTEDVIQYSKEAFREFNIQNKHLLVIIPDHTRNAPINLFFKIIFDLIGKKVKKLDYLIALGTHPPLSEEGILKLVGISKAQRETKYSKINFFNHKWDDPESLEIIGTISADEIYQITNGLSAEDVNVKINKLVFDYELLIIIGPVVPHEVAGFSGGNKYLFPGISGGEITGFFHWLGALITNIEINGKKETPVRKVFNRASSFLTIPKLCFSLVVKDSKLSGLFIGTPEETHSKAVLLSSRLHIINKEKPYQKEWHNEERVSVVPFLMTDPLPVLTIEFNGVPVQVIFDTGANAFILDNEIAAAMGIEWVSKAMGTFGGGLKAEVGFGKVDSVKLGDVTLKQVPIAILPTKRFSH